MAGATAHSGLILALVASVLSMSTLAYEILLTRIASVLLTNQYVFLIVGLALLGISVGAIADYSLVGRQGSLAKSSPEIWLISSAGSLLFALLLILNFGPEMGLLILSVSASLPFVVSGFVLSRLFPLSSRLTGLLYAADLVGAAVGALIVPTLFYKLGPEEAVLSLAAALAACGLLLTFSPLRLVRTLIASTVLIAVAGLLYGNRDEALLGGIPIGRDPNKDLYRITRILGSPAEIVESRWSTFGRTDLVRFRDDPSIMSLFIDGAAGAGMLRFNGRFEDSPESVSQATRDFGGMTPILALKEDQRNSALIIGPGGGRDVLVALQAGFRRITAV
jgi:hypothetical protein